MTTTPPPARRGRTRSEAADCAILDTALALLREVGYQGLTMSAVIERSGVSSATLYRRWPTKQALAVAVIQSVAVEEPACDTGSLVGDLTRFVAARVRVLETFGPFLGDVHRDLVNDDAVTEAMHERLLAPPVAQLAALLKRAAARGELAGRLPPAEVVLSLLLGPLHHRAVVVRKPVGPAFVRDVVAQAVAGLTTYDRRPCPSVSSST